MIEVPKISEALIQQKAWKILNEAYPDGIPVPVPVEELIEQHFKIGLEIGEINIAGIDDRIDGYADFYQNRIWINSQLEEFGYYARMRFTMAHELGHFYLHLPYLKDGKTPYQYAETYKNHYSRIEAQANMFAGSLLMPPPLMYKKWLEIRKTDEPYSLLDEKEFRAIPENFLDFNFVTSYEVIARMAELFETSHQSTKIQLGRSWFFTNSSVIRNTIVPSPTAQGLREKCIIPAL